MNTEQAIETAGTVAKELGFIDQLQKVTAEITSKIIEVTPKAAELLLDALQLRAGLEVVFGLVLISVAIFLLKKLWSEECVKASFDVTMMGTMFVVTPLVLVGLFAFTTISNLIMAISPEAGLALQAFDAIVK